MELLEKLAAAGFTLKTFPAYERHLGVEKYNCVALLEPTPQGAWKRFSASGYLLNGRIALLVEHGGEKQFVYKSTRIRAEGEPLDCFARFQSELDAILADQ